MSRDLKQLTIKKRRGVYLRFLNSMRALRLNQFASEWEKYKN